MQTTQETNKKELLTKLKEIADEYGLKGAVASIMVETHENDDELTSWVEDLLQHGCASGMVSQLIYYTDTCAFFDKHENDIEDLISERMDDFGYKTRPQFIDSLNGSAENMTQEKNLLAWFAFEETARLIWCDDLEQEY